ncbi:MAG: flp pilus-assembly TadE/G-like family protein [Corynebacterium sp.]|uniref:Rv3654c family TadE-like protein n=1 Tax=Corynebacterium sp. TaxID=1720 RepID=UPI0026DBB9BD|nr:Rv3654c family TadE-like protein [Corynebacterium sp.]MDO5030816.1 flp pilus-assembly TadE/G-like family protein [Corynebacterium sp.]
MNHTSQQMRATLRRLRREEEGSTTVAAALFIAAFVALTMVGVAAGVGVVKARQAAVAADLSAVAGAVAAQEGDHACEAAQKIASANQARVLTCDIDGEDVQVRVERRDKEATSRAGPAPHATDRR